MLASIALDWLKIHLYKLNIPSKRKIIKTNNSERGFNNIIKVQGLIVKKKGGNVGTGETKAKNKDTKGK